MGEYVEVRIPKDLYEKVEKFIRDQGGFSSVEEFIEFVVREAIESLTESEKSEVDEEKVKERLRQLGYI